MVAICYAERVCDVCGSGNQAEISAYRTKARTRSGICEWQVRNVVCRDCGFAFVSPAPTERSLSDYYADSFLVWRGEMVEFSIERRLGFLRRHLGKSKGGTFVEIGPNATEGFQAALAPLIERYVAVEPNTGLGGKQRTLADLSLASADIIGAYFVLEHVRDPESFLARVSAALKTGGLLVVEVPNLYSYGDNPAGICHFEHLTHFSTRSLAALAARSNLDLIEASDLDCSRPYGFVAAFCKSPAPIDAPRLDEFSTAHRCMVAGAERMAEYSAQLDRARKRITVAAAGGRTVVFWPANKPCADLLDGFDAPKTSVFIDSDPARSSYLEPWPVVTPDRATEAIIRAELFVIGSELHSAEILRDITRRRGVALADQQYVILSPGFVIGLGPRKI